MKLLRFTFSHAAWTQLSEAEQIYALRVAHLHNDLRHIRQLVGTANNGVGKTAGIEQQIALHQLLFAIRLLYGILNEGWNAVRAGWPAGESVATFRQSQSEKATTVHSRLSRYFSGTSLTRTVRSQFAFHYDPEPIRQHLQTLASEPEHFFITSSQSANIFYAFAEHIRNAGLLATTDEPDVSTAARVFYREFLSVWEDLDEFCKEMLLTLLEKCDPEGKIFESTDVVDVTARMPVIFVDEKAMIEHLRKRGKLPAE